MTDQPKRRRFWLKLAAGLLFALVAYFGAYVATVGRERAVIVRNGVAMHIVGAKDHPYYHVPLWRGAHARLIPFFAPAHWIDRRLRPQRWASQ